MVLVTAVTWVPSLAWEFPHTAGAAKKKKRISGLYMSEENYLWVATDSMKTFSGGEIKRPGAICYVPVPV